MLLDAPYPPDARVKKEADALYRAGYRLFLICARKSTGEPATDFIDGMHIIRIRSGKKWHPLMMIGRSNGAFKKAAIDLIRKENIRLLHVNDLPITGTGIHIKRKTGVTLVADFHENYAEAVKTWFSWNKGLTALIKKAFVFNHRQWFRRERDACRHCDHLLAVVEEMKQRLIQDHGVADSKVTVVTNTEGKGFIGQETDASIYNGFEGKFVVTYSGGLGPHRGLDVAIDGMALLKDQPGIQLVIIGSGNKATVDHLKQQVQQHQLSNVHFLGHMPSSKMYSAMHFAGVNIIPHISNGHTDNTIPHKLFQGMMSGRPLLVSSSAPLKRYMEATRAGLVFEAGKARDFADKVLELYQNPLLCAQLAENGKKATLDGDLNWEFTQKTLVGLYDRLLGVN